MSFAPGSSIQGRYVLERLLARGGMGVLWQASDQKLGRQVAIKVLSAGRLRAEELRTRFDREARAVAQLQSPHIVQVFDYGVHGDSSFIVMELLKGEDLRRRLKRSGRMTPAATADLLGQVAKGLGEAHAAGIIHRDLKPGNVFFARTRQEEVVKLLDFGVAKADASSALDDETTAAGQLLGTPRYMSPEQTYSGAPVDFRSDLFALGVIAYQALTGTYPFDGEGPVEVLKSVRAANPAPPSSVAPDLPPTVDAFIAQALAADPAQRFQSAREMAEAFRVAVGTGTSALEHGAGSAALAPEPLPTPGSNDAGWLESPTNPSVPTAPSWPSGLGTNPSAAGTLGSALLPPTPPQRSETGRSLLIVLAGVALLGMLGTAAFVLVSGSSAPESPAPAVAGVPDAADERGEAPGDDTDEPIATDDTVGEADGALDDDFLAEGSPDATGSKPPAAPPVVARPATPAPIPGPTADQPKPPPDPYGSRF